MTVPTWRSKLEDALRAQSDAPHARYVQLATLRPDGRPAVRTLVFRSFLDPQNRLVFTADTRSAKSAQLGAASSVEACWYFVETREQFRIGGRAAMIAGEDGEDVDPAAIDTRRRIWGEMSEDSRQTFTWPQPGAPLGTTADEFRRTTPHDPPANFALLVLTPDEVDHLELKSRPHRRTIYRLAGDDHQWPSEPVNP